MAAWKWINGTKFDSHFPWKNPQDKKKKHKCLKLDSRGFYAVDCTRKASFICAAGLFSCSSNTLGGTLWVVRK